MCVCTRVGRSLFRLHSLRDATELPQGGSLLTDWVEPFLFFVKEISSKWHFKERFHYSER